MRSSLATLLLLALAGPAQASDECGDCAPDRTCAAHLAIEEGALADLRPRLRERTFLRRKRALTDVAALNRAHTNAPSREVTQLLAEALDDRDVRVRKHAAELLGPDQHPELAARALASALLGASKTYELLGSEFEKRARRVGATAALAKGLDVRGVEKALFAYERQLLADRFRIRIPALILPPMPPIGDSSPAAKREYKRKKREYEKKKREADKKAAADEREAKKTAEKSEDVKALRAGLNATMDSLELAPVVIASLAQLRDPAGDTALRAYYRKAVIRCPSHSLPAATALIERAGAKDIETLVSSLTKWRRKVRERFGAADVSRPETREWAAAVHELLHAFAADRELAPPAEWSEEAPEEWAQWFAANGAKLTAPGH